jgi:hypothetical protein
MPPHRLKCPLLAIETTPEEQRALEIPAGEIVIVDEGSLERFRLIHVVWQDHDLLMFTQDLRELTDPVKPPDAPRPRRKSNEPAA